MSFQPNQQIFTCTAVNLRAAPGTQGNPPPTVLTLLPEGTACTVTGAAQAVDGLTWWPVRVALAGGQLLEGWAAERAGEDQLLAPTPRVPPVAPVQPEPPVAPLVAHGNRLGFYLHSTNNDHGLWDAIGRVQPPVMLIHDDAANDMLLTEIRNFRAPDALIIGRMYVTNDDQRDMLETGDPAGEGRRFAERILAHDFGKFTRRSSNGRLFIDAWMSLNECLPGPASSSYREEPDRYHRLYDAFDRFQVAFRERLVQEGIEAVAFNFAAGNFSTPAHYLDFFPETLGSYTYLGFHEYGWPSLLPGRGASGAGLFKPVLDAARARFGRGYKVVITEAGLTRAYGHPQNPDEGWLNGDETLDENFYGESLAWYNRLLGQDADVAGACLYQVGHRGDWATFRHLGQDNQGRTLGLVDRLVALREAAAAPAAAAAGPRSIRHGTGTVAGRVTSAGRPVEGALVRLVGEMTTLGAVRGAAVDWSGAVQWTLRVAGFAGTVRTAWDRFVAGHVAGLTWAEFQRQVHDANPGLAATGGRFVAGEQYLLPAASHDTPAFLWNRVVDGYAGTLRQVWLDLVQNKVLGMSYASFRRQFGAYNPAVAQERGRLVSTDSYLLPRTVGAERFKLAVVTSRRGRFRFVKVPAGDYLLEVEPAGHQPYRTEVTVEGDEEVNLELRTGGDG